MQKYSGEEINMQTFLDEHSGNTLYNNWNAQDQTVVKYITSKILIT